MVGHVDLAVAVHVACSQSVCSPLTDSRFFTDHRNDVRIHVHIVLIIRFALQRYELFCKPQDFHLILFIRAQAHTKHIYPIYIKGASECRVLLFLMRFRKA